jgi:hypothetical protein
MRELILRTQSEILADIEALVVDSTNALWSDAQIYGAINNAIRGWGNRVLLPRIYVLPSGFTGGVYEYDLPSYITKPFNVQVAITTLQGVDYQRQWVSISGWTTIPSATGGQKLVIHLAYDSANVTTDARIIWWAANGQVPTTIPTLAGTLAADGTSLTTSAAVVGSIPDAGWVKINGEWMSYAGVERGASSTTLTNLVRALYGTTAASHSSTPAINWGIAVDDTRLWEQMEDAVIARLHYQRLHRGTQDDRLNHEKVMGYAQQRADTFWRRSGYTPSYNTRYVISDRTI